MGGDRKSTRLNSSHVRKSYAVFCLKKKRKRAEAEAAYHRALKLKPDSPMALNNLGYSMVERGVNLQESFFFNDPATTEIYTLSLHDALPISRILVLPACAFPRTSSACPAANSRRSEEHTSELQSRPQLVCRLRLEKKDEDQQEDRNLARQHPQSGRDQKEVEC